MEVNKLKIHCTHCKYKSFLFTKLKEDELGLVNDNRKEIFYDPGEIILKQGQNIKEFLYLQKGLIKLVNTSHYGRERIISISRPMNFVSIISTFSSKNYPYSVIALEKSLICSIDLNTIKQVIKSNGEFALTLMSQISKSSDYVLKATFDIDNRLLRGRIAHILICFANDIYQSEKFFLPISRKEMGELINMTTENVIRILSEFRKDGLIEIDGKEITIINKDMLTKLSLHA